MAQVLTDESNYEDIADAIREKNGTSDTYLPSEMAAAVRAIQTGAVDSVNGKTGAVVLTASDVGAGTYSKPTGGIPKSDLASAVQTSLGKADAAYSKPSGGIPKSDLASAVQTSLGKADTALQTAPVTSVNSKTGAVNITPADIGAKAVQTAVNDPSSSGEATTMAFISNITQNAQGVVSPTKKTIPQATASTNGIMTSQYVITMLAAYGMGNAAEYSFAPSSRHEATYPIKAGSIFTHGGSSSYGEWLYRALVDIANANQISGATAEQIRVSDLYNELRSAIAATYPTDTAEGAAVSISDGADGVPVKALTVAIASGTGVTGVTITRTGKNLLDPSELDDTVQNGYIWGYKGVGYPFKGGVTYTLSTAMNVGSMRIVSVDEQTILAQAANNTNALTFTPTEDVRGVMRIWNTGITIADATPQLEIGASATAYEAGAAPEEYVIDFPQEAGSVTSGMLDVINGVLTTGGQDYEVMPADVRTLLGNNTIYADCGDVSVTYRADPTLQHDNLDAGDVGFTSYTGVYGNGTIGKAVRTLEDDLFSAQNSIDRLETAIIGNKMLIFNSDGSVTWEEAPS